MATNWFPTTYEESRARFRANLARVQSSWHTAHLNSQHIGNDGDLTVDWISAEPTSRHAKMLVFTIGEHGGEGYIGSAALKLFIEEYVPRLDSATTGLLVVHAINPWGMKHRRRTNGNNVDLNRNFLWNAEPDPTFNPDYARFVSLLMPKGFVRSSFANQAAFIARLLWYRRKFGTAIVRHTILLGQYQFAKGLFFGGTEIQPEVHLMMRLYRDAMREHDQIVHLDMHSGYGPRYQMQLVNSRFEPADSRELERRFNYPFVSKTNPSEFYEIRGDMIDYVYSLKQREFPNKRLYSTSFEFGTLGDSDWSTIRSLQIKVLENQAFWYGATANVKEHVAREFAELYAPREAKWRAKAIADARQAFDGILRAEGYLK